MFATDDERWQAVMDRDARAEGVFVYAVRTTGVYCRTTCPARRPLRRNVVFHASMDEAERAGFRPCRRCRPADEALSSRHARVIAYACRTIEEAETVPTLTELATAAEMSPFHFHRLFVAQTGVTPQEYARVKRLPDGTAQRHCTEAIRFAMGECWLGSLLVAASDRGVCTILLGDDPEELLHDLERRFPTAELVGGDAAFETHVARVAAFVAEPSAGLDLPLDIRGTAFQLRVWQVLRKVPAGSTVSYRELAERLGRPQSTRAVATACAANPLAVAIPCHRVIRTDGSLSGYRWGIERKRELLEREHRVM